MGKVIYLDEKKEGENLIAKEPFEFRRARWQSINFLQVRKDVSARYEREYRDKGDKAFVPPHFVLDKGMDITIAALFRHRNLLDTMKEIYLLATMMDLLINKVSPLLRTDLIRSIYHKVFEQKEKLGVYWTGPVHNVLLPLEPSFWDENEYRQAISKARTLKELYTVLTQASEEMFLILAKEYTFYCPNVRGQT